MDKSAIRNFAIEARKMLMKSAETEAGFYGVTKNECKSPIQKGNDFEVYETIAGTENRIYAADIKRRANLVKAVETLGFEQVIEETAYTWFNRIIAIRFMEVNDYLPTRVRVLSSETGSSTPDIVTQSLDVDLNMAPEELEKVQKAKDENRYDDAFRMLFIKQCNELNAILPGLFVKTDDYMELLLKLSYTSDGVVRMLVDSIDENNFNVETEGQVEIIGWMYQYYNTELKAEVFGRPSGAKIKKEDIPAATQLFTPDWIVRYMVENSVGRVWLEHLRALDDSLNEQEKADEYGWKYYLIEAEQEDSVAEKLVQIRKSYTELEPKDITCIDPCMGSGHILVYMFDVLMDIYRSEGFSERDAAFSILENNIRGLDIDKRAYQLSYFALMMKARGYNRTFFRGKQDEEGNRYFVEPLVLAVEESNSVNRDQLKYFGTTLNEIEKNNALNQINGLLDELVDAREYGSILDVMQYDWKLLEHFAETYEFDGQITFETFGIDKTYEKLAVLIRQGKVMSEKYSVVATNPPYMSIVNGSSKLNNYVKKHYANSKTDMFAVFIEKCYKMLHENGFQAMITQHAWMFLSSFEKLRYKMQSWNMTNLVHLGARAFDEISGEVVQTVTFVVRKQEINDYLTTYIRLLDYIGEKNKEKAFYSMQNRYYSKTDDFSSIPNVVYAYWIGPAFKELFQKSQIKNYGKACIGMRTGDNERFLRLWFEVDFGKMGIGFTDAETAKNSGKKWFPYCKGGTFRKWYGNNEYVVNWENNGYEIKENTKKVYPQLGDNLGWKISNENMYFKKGITWSGVGASVFGVRCYPEGMIFDSGANSFFVDNEEQYEYFAGLLNAAFINSAINIINPTINTGSGVVAVLPAEYVLAISDRIKELVLDNVHISKEDWDSYETSWEFAKHPLCKQYSLVENAMDEWKRECENRFMCMKKNEEELNYLFNTTYNIGNEVRDSVDENLITVRRANEFEDIRGLISYAVGCMFGRYSLEKDGLICTSNLLDLYEYKGFMPDVNGIIPITDTEYFNDDIVTRFIEFVSYVYGTENLEVNLNYIASKLETKGTTSREKIRNYFLNDFYKDHCNMYSVTGSGKRPIYWLFDSGKQNGFKCLIYMHRYNKDTLNLIRSEYLHKTEDAVENALKNAEYIIQTSASAVERAKATKDRDRYVKQLNEMRIYYQALSHLALQKIEINLDDGVKHNYQLFQGIEVIVDGGKKQKVDLLAKIG